MASHKPVALVTGASQGKETLLRVLPQWEQLQAHIKPAISRLRQKVEDDPSHPTLIQTVHGVGYRLILAPPATKIATGLDQPD